MRRLVLFLLLLIVISSLWSFDSGKKPFQAMALSLVIPGGGQFYNESYYKAAVIFALEGYLIGRTIYHHNKVNEYYDKAQESVGDEFLTNQDLYYRYYNRRQNDFWWLGTVIFLSMVDAFVDAHLYNYNQEKEKVHLIFERNKIGIGYNF